MWLLNKISCKLFFFFLVLAPDRSKGGAVSYAVAANNTLKVCRSKERKAIVEFLHKDENCF